MRSSATGHHRQATQGIFLRQVLRPARRSSRCGIAVNATAVHHARVKSAQVATIGVIKENVAQLHRDGRARIRRWLLDGFDVRGTPRSKGADAAADVPPEVRDLVLTLAPEPRAVLRSWVLAGYDVRGAVRARGSTR